jgi:hypothetical protein
MGRKSTTGLPRHVMSDGGIVYYWTVPPRARIPGCPVSAALGRDLAKARQTADDLNTALDRGWRRGEVRDLLGIPNGFLSSVER